MNIKNKSIVLLLFLIALFVSVSFCFAENLRPPADEIPVGSIIIGSHIIQLKVLNQEILDVAQKSAEQSSQPKVYYKSEFSNGTWYDITAASSIDDISKLQKNAVTSKTINDLKLTHWTKADGTTIEFETGKSVGMQDINNMQDPNNIPELEEMKTERKVQQEMLKNEKSSGKKGEINDVLNSFSSIFAVIEDKELKSLNTKMKAMDDFAKYLHDKKESDELINIVLGEKEQFKLQHDMECYKTILDRLAEALPDAKKFYDSNILKEYYNANDKINAKLSELSSKIRLNPVLTLDEMYSSRASLMNNDIFSASFEKAQSKLKELYYITNDKTSKVVNKEAEIKLLDEASSKLEKKISSRFMVGESTGYKAARGKGESPQVMKKLLDEGIADYSKLLDEMDSILGQYKLRKSADEQIKLLVDIIRKYQDLIKILPKDDFYNDSYKLLMDRINKLNALLNDLKVSTDPDIQNKLAEDKKLMDQMDALNEAYVGGMEEGDITAALNAKEKLDKLKGRQESISDERKDEYSELLSQESELEGKLIKTDSQTEKDKIQAELAKVEAEINKAEALLDAISSETLQKLEEAAEELKEAIAKGDAAEAADKLKELKASLEAASDKLISSKDKLALLSEMKALVNNKCVDLIAEGLLSEAESMKGLSSALKDTADEIAKADNKKTGDGKSAGNNSSKPLSQDPLTKIINESGLMDNSTIAQLIEYKEKKNVKNTRMELITEHLILKLIKDKKIPVSDKAIITKIDDLMKKNLEAIIAREKSKYKSKEASSLVKKSKKFASMGDKHSSISPYHVIFGEPNIKFKNAPVIFADKVLVSLQEIYKAFGAKVTYLDSYNRFVIQHKKMLLEFTKESNISYYNDKIDKLPVRIMDYDGTAYISAAYVAERYGLKYEYIKEYKCVIFYNSTLSKLIESVEKGGK